MTEKPWTVAVSTNNKTAATSRDSAAALVIGVAVRRLPRQKAGQRGGMVAALQPFEVVILIVMSSFS